MYTLPEELRPELARPMAPVLDTEGALRKARAAPVVVTVGDVVTQTLLEAGFTPRLVVIDLKTQRGPQEFEALRDLILLRGYRQVPVTNPPATIRKELWAAVRDGLADENPTALVVEGEEDLAVLPAVIHAPDDAVLLYGQPDEGVVALTIDADTRARVRHILERMEEPA